MAARIGGSLECDRGNFANPGKLAINADSLSTNGNLFLRNGFHATGEVNLIASRIGGQLDCADGVFSNPDGIALQLQGVEIAKDVYCQNAEFTGGLDLRSAKVNGIWTDSATAWPAKNQLWLNGFTYSRVVADPTITVRQRLEWLRLDDEQYAPQPYEQLASTFRREGNEHDARKVQISAQWFRRKAVNSWTDRLLRPIRVAWSAVLWATIGYGHRPWQILAPIFMLYAFGCWWFNRAAQNGSIIATNNLDPHIHFNAARYTADLLIPGATLAERDHFTAIGATAWWAAGYTLAGWALAAMLIAGLTGVFKRQ